MGRKPINNKTLTCPQCNCEFTVKEYSNRIYCSDKCSREHWTGSRKNSILVNCKICGKEYYAWPSRLREGKDKCCSKKCAVELMKTTSYLTTRSKEQAKRDTEKARKTNSGKNHHWWKGGITPQIRKERGSLETTLWRKACMERDNWTCQKTGQRGGKLAVHHINNFADFPELRTSIENGIILSDKSHREFHKKYGRRNNTKEQMLEYLNKNNSKGRFGII
jgi:hypothetical protein